MQEILKILFRTLYHLIRRSFARISESKVSSPNPKREHYISRLADSSRKHDSKGILPQEKREVLFTTYTDILGFQYIDSAKYTSPSNLTETIELVN